MRSKTFIAAVSLAVLVGLLFASLGIAKPNPPQPKPKRFEFIGIVKVVDYNNTTLTVDVKTGKKSLRKPVDLNAATAIVKQNGKVGKFTDLVTGDKVKVSGKIENNVLKATKIKILGGKHKGWINGLKATISAIDVNAKTITAKVKDGTAYTFKVDNSTKMTRDKFCTAIADLVVNDSVKVIAYLNSGTAIAKKLDAEPQIEGTVLTVDAANNLLTLFSEKGKSVTVSFNAQTALKINGSSANLTDITAGSHIEVNGNVTSGVLTASVVNVYGFEVEGKITAIDSTNKTVTVNGQNYLVDNQTKIEKKDGSKVAFSALTIGKDVKMRGVISVLGPLATQILAE